MTNLTFKWNTSLKKWEKLTSYFFRQSKIVKKNFFESLLSLITLTMYLTFNSDSLHNYPIVRLYIYIYIYIYI